MLERLAKIAIQKKAELNLEALINSIADSRPESEVRTYRDSLQTLLQAISDHNQIPHPDPLDDLEDFVD